MMRNSNSTATAKNEINAAMPVGALHLKIRRLQPVCSGIAKVVSHHIYSEN
jgi:hypothetical protein